MHTLSYISQPILHDTDRVLVAVSLAVRPFFDPNRMSNGDRGTNRRPVRVVRTREVQYKHGLYRMPILPQRHVRAVHRKQIVFGLFEVSSWKILGNICGLQRIDVPGVS